MNLLVSYKHSGDFWVRYMVEYSTKLPSIGPESKDKAIGELYPLNVNMDEKPFLHSKRSIDDMDKGRGHKAIFLVRNYRDVFVRKSFTKSQVDDYFFKRTYLDEGYDRYMGVLKAYEEWEEDKMLVYYEDLFSEPNVWIPKIFEFYGIDEELVQSMLDNYERNFRCCLGIFRRSYPGSDLTAHPESMNTDMRLFMNDIIMYNSPFLFGKYLIRYIEGK